MKQEAMRKDQGEVSIRPVTIGDRESILAIVNQTSNFSAADYAIAEELVDEAVNHPEKNDYRILCALDYLDAVVGYICYGPIPLTQGCYDLYWIAVDSRSGRQGVGRLLLQAMERALYREKGRRVYIDTSSTEPYAAARGFYEKHGFQPVCVLDDFYQVGDHKVLYMKDLGMEREL